MAFEENRLSLLMARYGEALSSHDVTNKIMTLIYIIKNS